MKEYKFILKPIFFVFNLVFATWLVLYIERLQPSDFGKKSHLFERPVELRKVSPSDKQFIMQWFNDYKYGRMDSATVDRKLTEYLAPGK